MACLLQVEATHMPGMSHKVHRQNAHQTLPECFAQRSRKLSTHRTAQSTSEANVAVGKSPEGQGTAGSREAADGIRFV